ncbi:hypothetical protein EZV62_011667 [Acer yangbiense]|uniref:NADP-dependent oxidoreductase domain-containing protein n=1 Tax=Acer yangbiense TaxID=1000413 RepID=A0A5C7I587_9ROSI|nr:hypothetical protein EZV62_011667 [Acer yangbiense]
MIKKATMPTLRLNNGFDMPILGPGVWRINKGGMRDLIINVIKIGYRHFDCAGTFSTPLLLFLLWNSDHGHVIEACKNSLEKLQLEYLDLYLVHFPIASTHIGRVGTTGNTYDGDGVLDIDTTISLETTWHDMESLVFWFPWVGLVRRIGISNYDVFLTRDCLAFSKVKLAVNLIETHPYFQRDSLVRFSQKHGIYVTAHTPLGGAIANAKRFGSISCLDDPVLKDLTEKYKKSVVQIVLRWGIQRNTIVIPKTSSVERLKENFNVFDFKITEEDMEIIKGVDRKHRTNHPTKAWGLDPYA